MIRQDISDLLRDWPFDPDNNIRVVRISKDREVIQVRQPMGIEQYEMDGRPDGTRPFGQENFLLKMQSRLKEYILTYGSDQGFAIAKNDFQMLQNEGILYYYRYLNLFQLNDYNRTIRDTEHNLEICRFIEKYAGSETGPEEILQYKPYILRINAVAHAMKLLNDNIINEAEETLEEAIEAIETMDDVDTPVFKFEKLRSVQYLRSTLSQIAEKEDDPIDDLQQKLDAAVEAEEYELAAELRDQINELTKYK